MPSQQAELDVSAISEIAGEELISLLFKKAPKKVASRIAKATDHYNKALRLVDVDDEMGAIRIIAAEEELVVAIFEWLKLKSDQFPVHRDFVKRFKNHQVKLAFYPVLCQFRFILADMATGFVPDGLEGIGGWSASMACDSNHVDLVISGEDGAEIIRANPFSIAISREDLTHAEIVDAMYRDFELEVDKQHGASVREFVTVRSDYRNKLLYAEDGGMSQMSETLSELLETSFETMLRDLLWTLGALICNETPQPNFGLVGQFVSLYRRVLAEAVDPRLGAAPDTVSS